MFQLIFGIIWTLFTGLVAFMFYCGNGEITVNGEYVTHEEFNAMLFPKLFLGGFLLIGIVFIIVGLKKIIKDGMTSVKGEECFGRIINIHPSGNIINGIPELIADVLIYMPLEGKTEIISEIIGALEAGYEEGCYVKVKHYNGDINFEERISEDCIPLNIRQVLEDETKIFIKDNKDEIVVDGVRYKKIDE